MTPLADRGPELKERFAEDGYLLLEGFYDVETEITPIQEGIRSVVELVARRHGLKVPADTPELAMTQGYPALIAKSRSIGGEVYDAIKQIPAFARIVASARNAEIFELLRPNSVPGVAGGGHGIRIDNPREEQFRAQWHQEFINQLRSLDGIVFWSPLLPVTQAMGPVELCPGSHRDGPVPVYEDDGGIGRFGAYSWKLDREDEVLEKYAHIAPLTRPGDVLLMDFLTLHASGHNVSDRPRWTMQWRYFNFADPVGINIGWKGSFAAGVKFQDVFPDLIASKASRAAS